EDLVAERVPLLVRELEGDAGVAADAAERRLLGERDRLTRGDDDDGLDDVLLVGVRPLDVVPEDQARGEAAERDLAGERDERARAVRAVAARDVHRGVAAEREIDRGGREALHATPEEYLVRDRVPLAVGEDEVDARVAADATLRRLLGETDHLARGDEHD